MEIRSKKLEQVALDESFTDRVAELVLMHPMCKLASPLDLPFRPVFSAAKKVIDPLLRKGFSATGEGIFRGGSSPDILTSFKNMVLPGYGQMKEMHGIRNNYMSQIQGLSAALKDNPLAKGVVPWNGKQVQTALTRKQLIDQIHAVTSQYRAEKERAFTAIGATAQPKIDMLTKTLPAAGAAAGIAGAGGLYMGDTENQRQLKETLQNKTLLERLKFLIFPRHSIQNYFMSPGQEKSSSAVARGATSSMPSTFSSYRILRPSEEDIGNDRSTFDRALRGEARGDFVNKGGELGGVLGALAGGGAGYLSGSDNAQRSGRALVGALLGTVGGHAAGSYAGWRLGGHLENTKRKEQKKEAAALAGRALAGIAHPLEKYVSRYVPHIKPLIADAVDSVAGEGVGDTFAATAESIPHAMHWGGHMMQAHAPGINQFGRYGLGAAGAGGLAYGANRLAPWMTNKFAPGVSGQPKMAAVAVPEAGSALSAILGSGIGGSILGSGLGGLIRTLHSSKRDDVQDHGILSRLGRGIGRGALTGAGAGMGGGAGVRAGSRLGARLAFALDKNPRTAALSTLIGSLAGTSAGGITGGVGGGVAGYELGGLGGAKPNLMERARYGLREAKNAHTKAAFAQGLGFAARKALGAIPAAGAALRDVTSSGLRGAAQWAGQTAGHVGVPIQNVGRAMGRNRSLFTQKLGQGWDAAGGKPMRAIVNPMTNPNLQPLTQKFDAAGKALTPYPANWRSKALGGSALLAGAGGLGVAGTAAFNPEYRQSLGQDVFSRQGWQNMKSLATSPDARSEALSQFGLPMAESGPDSQWHKPHILGY